MLSLGREHKILDDVPESGPVLEVQPKYTLAPDEPSQSDLGQVPEALEAPIQRPLLLDLPQEIIDYVVDFLHDDNDALRRCSLVARAWTASASYHLFYRMSWPICPHPRTGFRWGPRCKCPADDNGDVLDLRQAIADSSRLRTSLRHLKVFFAWHSTTSPGQEPQVKVVATQPSELVALVDLLPQLHSLQLSHVKLECDPPGYTAGSSKQRCLEKLTFHCPWSRDFNMEVYVDLLRHFHSIDVVQFHEFFNYTMPSAPQTLSSPSSSPPLPHIHALEFSLCTSSSAAYILTSLQDTIDLPALTRFQILHTNIRPGCALPTALPAFFARTPALHTLACDRTLFPFLSAPPPALATLRLHGRQFLDLRLCIASIRPTDWPAVFAPPAPLLAAPRLAALEVAFALEKLLGRAHDGAPVFGRVAEEVRAVLEGLAWPPVERAARAVPQFTLRFVLGLSDEPPPAEKARMLRMMREVVERRMPESLREIVKLEVC